MSVIIDLRIRTGGEWQPLPLAETQNMSLAEIAAHYDGQEVAFKYDNGEGIKGYFVGTGALVKELQGRGYKAMTFQQLAERPHGGIHVALPLKEVAAVFGGELEQLVLV